MIGAMTAAPSLSSRQGASAGCFGNNIALGEFQLWSFWATCPTSGVYGDEIRSEHFGNRSAPRRFHVVAGQRVLTGTRHDGARCSVNAGLKAMLTLAEEYRAKAEECAKHAEATHDPEFQRLFEDIARQWLNLAKLAAEADGGN